ncbi:GNAT family N-acetyltransferase [Effusibacillus dendaii]|uniref:N-acetyltransferase n=1 Tax=Effusibacillus dendaii TaxID=2743772 RepID=A0A7I8D584_9BACL|nr:GNAT family N-acetyltransferase [Effusibacillus dendaii]BCJ85227.1 N-acetyltransferase [Effusibacillus dendaii]
MPDIYIRPYQHADEQSVLQICYRTGFMGQDLSGTNRFNDRKLFGYLFCLFYLRYETEHCFVAVDRSNGDKVVGYILGTLDTRNQNRQFAWKMGWRIALRLLFYTGWRYTESFREVIFFLKGARSKIEPNPLYKVYPAHLHINVLPEYQHCGIGSKLLDRFEQHVRKSGVAGIHLSTSNRNLKAIPFYRKKGYDLLLEKEDTFWSNVPDYKTLVFAKKL